MYKTKNSSIAHEERVINDSGMDILLRRMERVERGRNCFSTCGLIQTDSFPFKAFLFFRSLSPVIYGALPSDPSDGGGPPL